jgi:hypothetical protein
MTACQLPDNNCLVANATLLLNDETILTLEYFKVDFLKFSDSSTNENINFTDMPPYYSFALPDNVSSQMALKPGSLCRRIIGSSYL